MDAPRPNLSSLDAHRVKFNSSAAPLEGLSASNLGMSRPNCQNIAKSLRDGGIRRLAHTGASTLLGRSFPVEGRKLFGVD
jgi:hypothetical protein